MGKSFFAENGRPLTPNKPTADTSPQRKNAQDFASMLAASQEGGTPVAKKADEIARLLGHNDPKKVEEFLNDEDH